MDKPHPARMYDYYLGGKDNFEADREAAEQAMSVVPHGRQVALANREFLVRAVETMADSGINQFMDLGTGFPTSPNVHEVAQASQRGARVVYVDNDPVVVTHNRALRTGPGVVAIGGDVRDPEAILADAELRRAIDFSRPCAVLFIAVLHFVPGDAAGIVAAFRRRLQPGSMIAVSHITSDYTPSGVIAAIEQAYSGATAPAVFRTSAGIGELFGDCPLLDPGLADVSKWRPRLDTTRVKTMLRILGGIARVP